MKPYGFSRKDKPTGYCCKFKCGKTRGCHHKMTTSKRKTARQLCQTLKNYTTND